MASYGDCFTQFATWSITGCTVFDLDEIPNSVAAADCPCIFLTFGRSKYKQETKSIGFTSGQLHAVIEVSALCLFRPVGLGQGTRDAWPGIITLYDTWLTAIANDPDLDGNLAKGMEAVAMVEWGVVRWGNKDFVGWEQLLRWELKKT